MLHDRYSQTKWVRGEIINDAMKESPSLVYFLAALMASYLALADLFRRRTLIRMYRSIGGSDKEKRYVAVYRSFLLTDVKREFSGKEINIESSKWMCTARFAGKPTQFWADYFEEPKFYNEITGMAPPPSKHKDTLEEILKKFEQPVAKEKRKATDWVDRIK